MRWIAVARVKHADILSVEVLVNRADSEIQTWEIVSYCLLICQNLNKGDGRSKARRQGIFVLLTDRSDQGKIFFDERQHSASQAELRFLHGERQGVCVERWEMKRMVWSQCNCCLKEYSTSFSSSGFLEARLRLPVVGYWKFFPPISVVVKARSRLRSLIGCHVIDSVSRSPNSRLSDWNAHTGDQTYKRPNKRNPEKMKEPGIIILLAERKR